MFFAAFDVQVQTAELWQLNSIAVKLALRLCLGSKSSNFIYLMPGRLIVANEQMQIAFAH